MEPSAVFTGTTGRDCAPSFRYLFASTGGSIFHRLRTMRDNAPVFFSHAKLFFQRAVNLGRGADLAQRALFQIPEAALDANALGEAHDGWLPALPKPGEATAERSASWGALLRKRIATPPRRDAGDRGSEASLSAKLKKITAAGATPVLVIPPLLLRQYYFYPERTLAERFPGHRFVRSASVPSIYIVEDLHVRRHAPQCHWSADPHPHPGRKIRHRFANTTRCPAPG